MMETLGFQALVRLKEKAMKQEFEWVKTLGLRWEVQSVKRLGLVSAKVWALETVLVKGKALEKDSALEKA